jgi:hypothetical protein
MRATRARSRRRIAASIDLTAVIAALWPTDACTGIESPDRPPTVRRAESRA